MSIVAVGAALALWSDGAQALAWAALVLVPPGCALALGWAARGGRPWAAALAVPLLATALGSPETPGGELARIALIAGGSVTAARLLGGASCDFGDFFAAALVGAVVARERSGQVLAAAATFLVTRAFDQLLLVVAWLPATVPPAVVMLGLEARRRRRVARAMPRPLRAP